MTEAVRIFSLKDVALRQRKQSDDEIFLLVSLETTSTKESKMGNGCGSVGRAVTSDATGPRLESSHQQTFIPNIYLLTDNCIERTKIKK